MDTYPETSLNARPEQLMYANVLEKGMLLGLVLILVSYALYIFGVMKPYVPIETIIQCWNMKVGDYLHHCHLHPGWAWLSLVNYGDFMNFVGIAILAGITILCFLAIVPVLWREKDRLYAVFAIVQALILCIAASGMLGSGGH